MTRAPLTSTLTLLAYLSATFSPMVAAAAEAEPQAIAEAERFGGGSLSTREDRAAGVAVGEGPTEPPQVGTPSITTEDPADGAGDDEPALGSTDGDGDDEDGDGALQPAPDVVAQA